jgi:hypothetical protein
MRSLFLRLWRALRFHLLDWAGAKTETPPMSPPAELESLRRQAAALSALASKTRLEISALLKHYDSWDHEARRLLHDGHEDDARPLIAQMDECEQHLAFLLHEHKSQQHSAEAAIEWYRQANAHWKQTLQQFKYAGRLERTASRLGIEPSPSGLTNSPDANASEIITTTPSESKESPVGMARELLNRTPDSERITP